MKKLKFTIKLFIPAILFSGVCFAQRDNNFTDTVNSSIHNTFRMAAGSHFTASGWKQFWWGKHWRKEWLEQVEFPIFDLDTTAGGLTALERGGGHETKTLRLRGKNGKDYVLRTMDKSLDILVPEAFKGSFVNDLVNDQISTAHPYGPLAVASLSGSIGIMHTNPVIVYVPDNPLLGAFKNDFADKLCLFEERPSGEGWNHTNLTRYSDDVINSEKLFAKLDESNKRQVDQKEFLKVRLFDMLINDWDRHEDQWVWTAQKKDGKTIYQPFARDRDQSFSKTDGVNLYFLSRPWAVRSIQNMNPRVTDVIGSNLSATALDKKFTNALTKDDWKGTIVSLQQLLTDSVIREALKKMPAAIYTMSGEFLYGRLRARRDDMMNSGMRYYKILNKEVTLTGTDQQEFFTIDTKTDHTTTITIQATGKGKVPGDTLFHRSFDPHITRSINLYGLDGNDVFVFTGNHKGRILVRSFGGDGNDIYQDQMDKGVHLRKSKVYDVAADVPAAVNLIHYHATSDTAMTNYHRRYFKYDWWMPLLIPGYNPDDGILIGAAFSYKKQRWNKNPFGWQQTFGGNYAAATGAYSLFYKSVFKQFFGKWDLDIAANYKAPAFVINFYGSGNETELLTKVISFYRVRARSLLFSPGVSRDWGKNGVKGGLVFNTVKVQPAANKFINFPGSLTDSSVYNIKYFAGAHFSYTFSTANNVKYPTKGISFHAGSSYLLNLKETKRNFVCLQPSFTFYYSPVKNITIAQRTGAATNLGDYEFYQASTIGGTENLRGYWRSRFSGRSSFYQNTDIRIELADLKGYVLRGNLGIYGFFDDGRVWIQSESSNTIHTGYGGGIYFIPYSSLAINLSYGCSKEVNVFTFRTGFLF